MLHFLRPEWLLALLPIFILLWFIFKHKLQQGSWQTIIDPKFQQILLDEQQQQKQSYLPLIGLAILWLAATIALAGPSWQQVKTPSEKVQQGTVILLDNSLSMLAEDIKPNRISRARYKLVDFLTANPHLSTGLVIYSGSAHTLSPISDDNQTILSLLPNINPTIMPSYGSDALQGLAKAIQLLQQSRIKSGHIIWLLDDVNLDEIAPLKSLLAGSSIQLTLLAVGTEKGAPISVFEHGLIKDEQGKIIIAKLADDNIRQLASELGASLLYLQNDSSDVEQLSQQFSIQNQKVEQQDDKENEKDIVHWLDNGIYLLLPLVLLLALAFRRGWLVSSILMGCILLPPFALYSPNAVAEDTVTGKKTEIDFLDFFKSPNHQGFERWQKQDYHDAIERFSSLQWKAASHFRLGEMAQAQKQFELDKSPTGRFNEGNALAKQGQYAEAKKQFEKALELKADFTSAKKNLDIINKIMAKNQQQKKQQEQKQQQNSKQGKQPNQQGENQSEEPNPSEQQGEKDSPQDAKGSKSNSNNKSGNKKQEKESTSNKNKQNDAKNEQKVPRGGKNNDAEKDKNNKATAKPDKKTSGKQEGGAKLAQTTKKELSEKDQAQQAWLNQIPDDPGFFLKNKFEYQYQYQQQKNNNQQQTNKGKIW